jgi:hypothetical protein
MLELIFTLYLLYISFENKYHPIIELIKILFNKQKGVFPPSMKSTNLLHNGLKIHDAIWKLYLRYKL